MYKRKSDGWMKHFDFLLLDMVCLQIAFLLSFLILGRHVNPYADPLYRNMALILEVMDLTVMILFGTLSGVLKKGYYRDFVITVQHGAILGALSVVYLFTIKEGQNYSRLSLLITFILYIFITYGARELHKRELRRQMETGVKQTLFIVTSRDMVGDVIANMKDHNYARYKLTGAAVIDDDQVGRTYHDVTVVANKDNVVSYICHQWVDEVLIVISDHVAYPQKLINQLAETGVTVHLNLAKASDLPGKKQFVEKVGNYTVLTTSINCASERQILAKRMMDIAGGLVGCLLTGIIFIFVAPAIYISSPGPIFFAQERIGLGNKPFKMYKFRSMGVQDPKKEAKEWTTKNDARVTPVGRIIRKTSLDELPQFWNVLKGDMSLIGPRPERPLFVEKFKEEIPRYMIKHQVRPGITGWAQVNGFRGDTSIRSRIEHDLYYIENWSLGLDIKILFLTFFKGFVNKNAY